MKKLGLKISRYIISHLPRGKSIASDFAAFLFGEKFGDIVTLPDGRKFYIRVISPVKRHIFYANAYEERGTHVVRRALQPGDYVVDVGASFGWYVTLMSRLVGASGRVFAFEMVPDVIQELRTNISLNNLENNLSVESVALGQEEKIVEYLYSESTEMGNFYAEMLKDGQGRLKQVKTGTVNMTSLDAYAEKNAIRKVNFIKCDIDGAEVPFLRGARKTISTNRPIMMIEVNERVQNVQGHSCYEIFQELNPLGYKFFSLRSKLTPMGESDFRKNLKGDIVCLPGERLDLLPTLAADMP